MKFLSSIFSFDTWRVPPRELWRPGLVLAFVGYLLLELSVRSLVPDGHRPSGAWRNVELRDQAHQLASMPAPDIMFTGSSISAVNLPPQAFEDTLAERDITLTAFNAGIRGCNYLCIGPGLEDAFLSRARPKYVVLVVAPVDINEGNKFVTRRSQSFLRTFKTSHLARVFENTLSEMSWLFGFRAEIQQWFETHTWRHELSFIGIKGHINLGFEPRTRFPSRDIVIDPLRPISQALLQLAATLRESDIDVIVIEGLGDSSLHAMLTYEDNQAWAALFTKLDAIAGVRVVDVSDLRPADDQFIDRVHLNPTAAAAYARRVAQRFFEAGFPWDTQR